MGVFDNVNADQLKDQVNQHEQQVDQAVEKGGDALDAKTGDKFSGQVDKGQEFVEGKTGNL